MKEVAEFQELIKNFDRIRDYMRQFYVYGYKSRSDYDGKSARTYDNERRRIESWLSGFDTSEGSVHETVEQIRKHPLLPHDITVRGFVIDSVTGKLTEITI